MICQPEMEFPWLLFLFFYRFAAASAEDHCQDHHPPGEHREGPFWRGVEGPLAWRGGGSEDLLLQRGALLVPWGRNLPDCHASSWEHPGLYCCRQQRSDINESSSVPLSWTSFAFQRMCVYVGSVSHFCLWHHQSIPYIQCFTVRVLEGY